MIKVERFITEFNKELKRFDLKNKPKGGDGHGGENSAHQYKIQLNNKEFHYCFKLAKEEGWDLSQERLLYNGDYGNGYGTGTTIMYKIEKL